MLGYGSSRHTLMAACFSRVMLVVSYIGPYLSTVREVCRSAALRVSSMKTSLAVSPPPV